MAISLTGMTSPRIAWAFGGHHRQYLTWIKLFIWKWLRPKQQTRLISLRNPSLLGLHHSLFLLIALPSPSTALSSPTSFSPCSDPWHSPCFSQDPKRPVASKNLLLPETGVWAAWEFILQIWAELKAIAKDFPKPRKDQQLFIEEFSILFSI